MLKTEAIPIENYVQIRFTHHSVTKLIANWRVEPETLQQIVVQHFRDMGIFFVQPRQEKIIEKSLIQALQNSPEIVRVLKRAEQQEMSRRRNRHSD